MDVMLSEPKLRLLEELGTSYTDGKEGGEDGNNRLRPPVDCPKWVCCLLPCIKNIPSMKRFRQVQPHDAEVLRQGGEWVNYDASTISRGDILRIREGDRVPADCVVLSIGYDHLTAANYDSNAELVVDDSDVTGRVKPITITASNSDTKLCTIHYASQVLHGSAIVVANAVGSQTKLASLIRQGKWPPSRNNQSNEDDDAIEDEEAGVSLLQRTQ